MTTAMMRHPLTARAHSPVPRTVAHLSVADVAARRAPPQPSSRLHHRSSPGHRYPRLVARQRTAVGSRLHVCSAVVPSGDKVLVLGSTGGVGQIVTAKLLERGYSVRATTRDEAKAKELFGGAGEALDIFVGDTRKAESLTKALEGVDAIVCCTGTTAFPSKRWDGDNGPEQTDYIGTKNLVSAAAAALPNLKRFVLVSSVGVDRYGSFPFIVLNAFGVLKFKKMGEECLRASGLPFTIIRPGRLTDGPYTSFDLNTLLKATSGSRQDVQLSARDDLNGEASRIAAAECAVQALGSERTEGAAIAISSKEGDGPGQDADKWGALFAQL